MSNRDFAVGTVSVPAVGGISKKPYYLVVLSPSGKAKGEKSFISIDKPDLLNGFIQAKGFYTDSSEDDLTKELNEIVNSTPKETYIEVLFPWHRVQCIRNLMFNAVKPTTVAR